MLLCSVQVKSDCSFAQTTLNDVLYRRKNFVFDTFRRRLDIQIEMPALRPFLTDFFGLSKVLF